ncbi:MAG: protein-L-isoaspartate(D-aspartate) O-methyltransferase, partial [bacterium]
MVEKQIIARGIKDNNVINAMLKVPRHRFVPEEYERYAYTDGPLSIGEGQTISQPYIVALMTEVLELKGGERVLEIGTGSGYQAAILSLIAKEVYTIEIIPALAESAQKRLKSLGYKNVYVECGDGFLGWPGAAPFDGIIITCAAPRVPEPLI